MATGIILPIASIVASRALELKIENTSELPTYGAPIPQVWTPPQYSKPALTILRVLGTSNQNTGQPATPEINYVFDAVLKIQHQRSLVKTQHPVLTGPNISDHAYVQPARVTLEIGMSDVMSSYPNSPWVGAATKSISAWLILKQLQQQRNLLTLITRLDVYSSMLIENIGTSDDNRTLNGLRASVTFSEVISANVSSVPVVSTRPQSSGTSGGGTEQGTAPNDSLINQHQLPEFPYSGLPPYDPTNPLPPGIFAPFPYVVDPSIYDNIPGAGVIGGPVIERWPSFQGPKES